LQQQKIKNDYIQKVKEVAIVTGNCTTPQDDRRPAFRYGVFLSFSSVETVSFFVASYTTTLSQTPRVGHGIF
jgi:hypothetical protein